MPTFKYWMEHKETCKYGSLAMPSAGFFKYCNGSWGTVGSDHFGGCKQAKEWLENFFRNKLLDNQGGGGDNPDGGGGGGDGRGGGNGGGGGARGGMGGYPGFQTMPS